MSADRTVPEVERATVLVNERLAEGVGRIVLGAPKTSATIAGGQFVHVRIAEGSDFILRRPFSVFRAAAGELEILYQVVGRGTLVLAQTAPGQIVDLIGPLGRGWWVPEGVDHALVVAGGLGVGPMGMLLEELARRGVAATVAQGATSEDRLLGRDVFEDLSRRYLVATDDGSAGVHGLVTAVTEEALAESVFGVVYVCGPEPMERAVAAQAAQRGIPCQVSLERLMACGVGACLSCVVSTIEGRKRACVDGPVFDATELVWTASETRGVR